MAEDGHYEKVGDVYEWRWADGKEPKVVAPKGEFNPVEAAAPKAEAASPKAEAAPVVKEPVVKAVPVEDKPAEIKRGPGRPRKVEE